MNNRFKVTNVDLPEFGEVGTLECWMPDGSAKLVFEGGVVGYYDENEIGAVFV